MSLTSSPQINLAFVLRWRKLYYDTEAWDSEGPGNPHVYSQVVSIGKPDRVEFGAICHAEVIDVATCESTPGSWYWDPATTTLYVHVLVKVEVSPGVYISGSGAPAAVVCALYYWELFSSHDNLVIGGLPCFGYLGDDFAPEITSATSSYHEGGTKTAFGELRILNGDGHFDARLADYVYEGQKLELYAANVPAGGVAVLDELADFTLIWAGWAGNITWTDEAITVQALDARELTENA